MDFRGRTSQSEQQPANRPAGATVSQPAAPVQSKTAASFSNSPVGRLAQKPAKLLKLGSLILLFSVTALVIALAFLVAFGGSTQKHAVSKDNYQAVFLNNGQVYFGKIARVGGPTMDLRTIYYLQTNSADAANQQAAQNTNVSLVKLGCELHAPFDRMLINSDQIIFWENIQDDSQVVKAINEYQKQNTGKQNCSQQSQNSTQQAPTGSTGGTSTDTSAATPTTGTGTTVKKP